MNDNPKYQTIGRATVPAETTEGGGIIVRLPCNYELPPGVRGVLSIVVKADQGGRLLLIADRLSVGKRRPFKAGEEGQ